MLVVLQRQVPVIQQMQETVEVPRVWCTDKIIDVPVARQRQIPTIQTAQRTAEVPRDQFVYRVVGVPVATQTQVPYSSAQERIQERIVDETDVPHAKEEIIEVVRRIPQEQLQGRTLEQTVVVPVPRVFFLQRRFASARCTSSACTLRRPKRRKTAYYFVLCV